jgi:hypothetical protein
LEVLTAVVMKIAIFRVKTPRSPLKLNQCFGGTCRLQLQDGFSCLIPVSCLAFSSTVKIEAKTSSEISDNSQCPIERCVPKGRFYDGRKSLVVHPHFPYAPRYFPSLLCFRLSIRTFTKSVYIYKTVVTNTALQWRKCLEETQVDLLLENLVVAQPRKKYLPSL